MYFQFCPLSHSNENGKIRMGITLILMYWNTVFVFAHPGLIKNREQKQASEKRADLFSGREISVRKWMLTIVSEFTK